MAPPFMVLARVLSFRLLTVALLPTDITFANQMYRTIQGARAETQTKLILVFVHIERPLEQQSLAM